jgi:hypothetical protein
LAAKAAVNESVNGCMTACKKADRGQCNNQPNKGVVKVGSGGGGDGNSEGSGDDGDNVGGKDSGGDSNDNDNGDNNNDDDGNDGKDNDETRTMTTMTMTVAVVARRQRQQRRRWRCTMVEAAKAAGNESIDDRMAACDDKSGCRTTTQQPTK